MRSRAMQAGVAAIVLTILGLGLTAVAKAEDPFPTLVPVRPQPGLDGSRVVQEWTGTMLYVRDGWTVETLDPAPDLGAAEPGDAWEAIRLTSPLGQRTCSLYVAVANEGQPSLGQVSAQTRPRPISEPRWDLTGKRPTLLYPDPALRLAPAEAWNADDADAWTNSCYPGLEHEVLQVWACGHVFHTDEPWPLAPLGIARVLTPEPVQDGSWGTTEPAGQMLQPRADYTATLLPDGRVLVVGGRFGSSLANAEIWDPLTRSFQSAGEMMHRRMDHTAVLQPDGEVLVVGGNGRFGATIRNAELWDPLTSTFSSAGVLRTPRTAAATVTGFPDGSALVVGGGLVDGRRRGALRAEVWDPRSRAFEAAGRLASERNGHRTFALPNGDAVVTGPGNKEWLRWDTARRRFEPVGGTVEPRSETYQLTGGRVIAVGVNDERTCRPGKAYASTPDAELWLPRQGVFRSAGAFKSPRYEASVTPLPDGSALFYGGGIATCNDATHLRSAELWDSTSRTFLGAGRTRLPHWEASTVVLRDGRVAVIGGQGTDAYTCSDAVLGSIELWDPITRSFSLAGALDHPRSGATVVPLGDGSVLILGGLDEYGDPVAEAELWWPPVGDPGPT